KPLRIFLQDGSNDNNIYCGDWWVANQDMLSSFDYSGYEVNHVWGEGYHGQKHGAAIMPDVLRWLWKDWPKRVTTHYDRARNEATEFLIDGEGWELVSEGHGFTEGPAVNAKGELFFSDLDKHEILKVDTNGKVSIFATNTQRTNGLAFGPDGRLYGARTNAQQIVVWDMDGNQSVHAEGIAPNDLVVGPDGVIYCTEPRTRTVWRVDPNGKKTALDTEAMGCNGVILSADQSLLYVTDYPGRFVYSYQIAADGSLVNKQPFVYLHVPANRPRANADGMAVDKDGWLLTATAMGVQISDQPGRVHLILPPPHGGAAPANVTFDGNVLYATCGDKVYKRKVNMTGVRAWEKAVELEKPRL
ncbi:MAG: SMP-30/gluconolactonase/LRE family protein, partial [Planctomycetota bacterium]